MRNESPNTLYRCTEPIFQVYVMPNISDNISYGVFFPPEENFPKWLEYLEFYVTSDNSVCIMCNDKSVELKEGYYLVYNTVLECLQEICESREDFEERYW